MKLQRITPRQNWQQLVESQGLLYHTQPNTKKPYWVEDTFISLNPPELENLKNVINTLHSLCLSAIPSILESKDTLSHYFQLPEIYHEYFISSWIHHQNNDGMDTLYGRFDLAFDKNNIPKMLEYNADTPTTLIEAAVVQREWALDCFNDDSKHWNQIEDSLISTWSKLHSRYSRLRLDTTSDADTSEDKFDLLPQSTCKLCTSCIKSHVEDYQTTRYIEYTASEAGWDTEFIYIEDVGWNDDGKSFVDLNEARIQSWFKLYPWEWLIKESFGQNLLSSPNLNVIEPPWKLLLSCKSILPILHHLYPSHPNLLPSFFTSTSSPPSDSTPRRPNFASPTNPLLDHYVSKPIYGREGSNISIYSASPPPSSLDHHSTHPTELLYNTPGPYTLQTTPVIHQQSLYSFHTKKSSFITPFEPELKSGENLGLGLGLGEGPLEGYYPVIGGWVVDHRAVGWGIRIDRKPVTGDDSWFVPWIVDG